MPAFRKRIERLERVFAPANRIYTDDQWDGIFLLRLAQCLPEHFAAEIRKTPIYEWAQGWHAKRAEEMREWSDEQRRAAAERQIPDDLWDSFRRTFILAWNRQIPDTPCPLLIMNGELVLVDSAPMTLMSAWGSPES